MINASIENKPAPNDRIKNQKENPAVTANALDFEDENFILYRINECNKSTLG